jgi:hypothetical protein
VRFSVLFRSVCKLFFHSLNDDIVSGRFEDAKGVTIIRNSKKDKQRNGQKKKDKLSWQPSNFLSAAKKSLKITKG